MNRRYVGWVALLFLACASRQEATDMTKSGGAEGASMLECSLSVPERLKVGEPVELTFRLRNATAQPLYVLDWHTPLEGLLNSILEVTREGTEIPYRGPMLKRAEPGADDYVAVAPGATVEKKIEASLAYDFQQPGTYRIAFPGPLMDVATQQAEVPHRMEQFRAVPVHCPVVETTIVAP